MYHFDTFLFIYSKAMLWTLVQSSSEYISAFSTLIIKKDGNNQMWKYLFGKIWMHVQICSLSLLIADRKNEYCLYAWPYAFYRITDIICHPSYIIYNNQLPYVYLSLYFQSMQQFCSKFARIHKSILFARFRSLD